MPRAFAFTLLFGPVDPFEAFPGGVAASAFGVPTAAFCFAVVVIERFVGEELGLLGEEPRV
jgi:hypothetical protein